MAFDYKARSAYDVEQRIGQDREGPKVSHADSRNEMPDVRAHQRISLQEIPQRRKTAHVFVGLEP